MTRLVISLVTMAATVATLGAQQSSNDWSALTTRLDTAVSSGSALDLRAIRGELMRMLASPSFTERHALVEYTMAYTAWRMAFLSSVPDRERDDALDDADKRLQAILNSNPRDAEAHALLGSVYGAQIRRSPLKAVLFGHRVSGALDRAAELSPGNPRVALQQGISAFNTPAMFGGGLDTAEGALRRSLDLFAGEPADRPWPNWGRVDAYAWLGQALWRKGDRAGARAQYDKALAIAPGSRWVRHVLMPALDRSVRP